MTEAIVAAILAALATIGGAPSDPIDGALVFHERAGVAVKVSRDTPRETPPDPVPASSKAPSEVGPSPKAWAALRACESGHLGYTADTGNGYFGAYQFDLPTWASYGPAGNPAHASPAEQDRRALALYRARGSQPWPVCGRYLEE